MTSGVEKSSDKRKRERSGDERYIEAKGNEAVVDGDRCKKKMYKEEREKDRGKEVRKEERKEGRTRKDEAEKEEWNSLRSSMRAKWSAKTETARCATASSVGRTQGLPATSAEGSFTTLPFLFFVDFFQLFETAYETSCSLSLSLSFTLLLPEALARSFQWSRKRISRRFHHEIFSFVHKWYDCAAMQLLKCHFQRKINVFYLLPISYFQCLFSK